jgi:hypothetical protein
MSRQTRNSKARLEESTQTTPSLSRYAKREAATSPIKMFDNENDVDDFGGAEGGDKHAAADLHSPKIAIPDGIDPATANLLKMQMTMMQTLMATQLAQMEKDSTMKPESDDSSLVSLPNVTASHRKSWARLPCSTWRRTETTLKRGS